jgi:hypothetical protein
VMRGAAAAAALCRNMSIIGGSFLAVVIYTAWMISSHLDYPGYVFRPTGGLAADSQALSRSEGRGANTGRQDRMELRT